MGSEREVQVPDIGDFEDVDVIEVLVAPGDRVRVEQSLVTLESESAVAALAPDPAAIASFGVTGVNCVAGAGERWKSRMFWPRGEAVAARAAGAAGTVYTLSTLSGCRMEDVKAASAGPCWYQVYLVGGRDVARAAIDRARAAGFSAIVVTIDTPIVGLRERDVRNGAKELLTRSFGSMVPFVPQLLARLQERNTARSPLISTLVRNCYAMRRTSAWLCPLTGSLPGAESRLLNVRADQTDGIVSIVCDAQCRWCEAQQ